MLANQLTGQNQKNSITPFMQSGLDAIKNNDSARGEEIANNILKQAGISREQAMQMAHQRGLI